MYNKIIRNLFNKLFKIKKRVPDIAYDRHVLKPLLQNLVEEMLHHILDTGCASDMYSSEFQFEYDSEWRKCEIFMAHVNMEFYELKMQVSNSYLDRRECLISENTDMQIVVGSLFDCSLVQSLYDTIYRWEEGMYVEQVIIPEGVQQLAPMIFETERRKDENQAAEYPLYKHDRIGTLVFPGSLDIPQDDCLSPFASYVQRAFVWNGPTKCQKIRITHIDNHSPNFVIEDGVLYSSDRTRLIYCFVEKSSFVVPKSVTIIGPFAFCLQKSLRMIYLHDGITTICTAAFMACRSLTQIVIPKQVKNINCDTFDGCTSLCNVTIPDGAESIEHNAFRGCRSLSQITLPNSLKTIYGFEGCSSLREIDIPAGVENISGFMFCDSLRKVTLHRGVKRIDGYAFRYCGSLSEINFPEGLEEIGDRAFMPSYDGTNGLTKIVFPSTLRKIGVEAFYYNCKLRSVEFHSNIKEMGEAAFARCSSLEVIDKPNEMKINDNVFIQDKGLDKWGFWD